MRPLVPKPIYIEYICAFLVLLFLYLHYFLFIPRILVQKKYALYIVVAIVSAFVWSCCEIAFLSPYLMRYFYSKFSIEIRKILFEQVIFSVFLRNIALLAIYVLLSLYENAVREVTEMKAETVKQMQVLKVKDKQKRICFVKIPQLIYCWQDKNYTHYYTDGGEYTSRTALKEIKELLGNECIQMGRNLLVMRHAVLDQNDSYVTLCNPSDPENPIILSVS